MLIGPLQWLKLCHHKVMRYHNHLWLRCVTLMCVQCGFLSLLLWLFPLTSNASKKISAWQHWSSPTFGTCTPKCQALFISHFASPSQSLVVYIKANIFLIIGNVMEERSVILGSHCMSHRSRLPQQQMQGGFREVHALLCNALCTFCHFNFSATLGFW